MRLLIVEDDHKIADALKKGLERHSYAVDVAYDGDSGLAMATTEPYDLVLLDRMLPGSVDGMGILQAMRTESLQTPVLLLTAKDHVIDRAEGLNAGADDYLVKPFAFVELIARIRALLRRPQTSNQTTTTYKDVVIDRNSLIARRKGTQLNLSAKEFALLEYLVMHPERIITKEEIIQHVWDYDADILPNTVEVYIGYIRRKVDKAFPTLPHLIHTRRGFGYYFGDAP